MGDDMNKVIDELRENKKFIVSIFIAIVLMAGISYAWYTLVINKDTSLNLRGKTGLDIELVEPTDPITVSTAIPMADADGLETTAYQFKVVNNDSENIAYQLYLDDVELESGEHKIPDSNIKYSLTRNGGSEAAKLLTTTHKTVNNKTVREIDDTIIKGKTTNTAVENVYTLKLWIDSEATTAISGYKFKAKLRLEAVQTEDKLDDTYSISGYLYDDNNQPIANGTVAVFSEPKYVTTNAEGYFKVVDVEYGKHDIYYVPNKTVSEIENLTKSEVAAISGVEKAEIKTGNLTDEVELTSGFTIKDVVRKKILYNEHIKAVYDYNQNGTGSGASYTGCLGGAEKGCVAKSKITSSMTYSKGTIVKYEVAPGVEKYFNVIKDNGETLTMQQREDTITKDRVDWYSTGDNRQGPLTVLAELESVTNSWTNVNTQNYSIGGESSTLGYSACKMQYPTYDCSYSKYSLTRKAKARMITVQELLSLGCSTSQNSCMRFVNNYMYHSTDYGGSFNVINHGAYYTMSTVNDSNSYILDLLDNGKIDSTSLYNYGTNFARAVVEVNK